MKNLFIYTTLLMAFGVFLVGMFYPFIEETKSLVCILCSAVTGIVSVILFVDVYEKK